ncbi:MAG: gliding motility-associated C-terminal domain-containing protein [Chitinophagaceae bacterium]|nr:gliding motility-associated C-terminal domain-containing protein [Chitinophagaceae bacterium]MBP6589143.1 gliding motility-associated C-terminal domain-containing protein [Chitinophagaceae bacterium]MBP8243893.1 gliding motility-associated C-terminal domain-containing protein [Chitinophagaceae bacterium]
MKAGSALCFTRYPFCYLLFLLSFISTQLPAQAPTIYWEQYYGGTKVDFSGRLKKTVDNGFVIAGYGQSVDGDLSGTNNGFNDFELIKLDACGNKLWGKVMGGNHQDLLYAMSETTEHGFLLSGITFSTNLTNGYHGGTEDAIVCKTDDTGNTQWIKTFGGSQSDILFNAVSLPDSSCIIVGFTSSTDGDGSPLGKNGWVMKLDKNGNIIWNQFPGTGAFYFYDIIASGDGNFILCDYNGSLVKIDGAGNLLWEKNYGGKLVNIEKAAGDGFIACGIINNNPGGQDGFVERIDAAGNLLWQKSIGGSATDYLDDLLLMPGNTYILAGYSNSSDGDIPFNRGLADGFALALNDNGTIIWTKSYGGSRRDEFHGLAKGDDGSILLSGFVGSSDGDVTGNHASWDFVLLKLKDKTVTNIDSVSCQPLFISNILLDHDSSFTVIAKDICNYDSAVTHYNVMIRPEMVHTINDTAINYLDRIQLTSTATGPVIWKGPNLSCYNCLSPVTSPLRNDVAFIIQTGQANCMVSDTVQVTIKSTDLLYVPSAFTPNGDGKNDLFNALGIVSDYTMEIFNRWGERVFRTNSLQSGWNGQYKGVLQPNGIFVYLIRYKTSHNILKQQTGTISLIR